MIRVWGRVSSSNVMKVLWTLDELALPYERIDAGGPYGRNNTPEYKAMNPLGVVPTLEEDGAALFESNAIIRYLCNRHAPGYALYPAAPAARGLVDGWLDLQQTALTRPHSVFFMGLVRTPPERRDMAAIDAAVVEAGRIWALVDARVGTDGFICGAALTLADIAWGCNVHRWFNLDIARPDLPNLRGWYDRLLTRPAYRTHVADIPIT